MKLKKLLSLALSLMLILSVIPMGLFSITASAETATSGTTGDCTWTLDGTVLTISGNGYMEDCRYSDSPPWGINVTEVIIKAGVKDIGGGSFRNCTALTSITIPNSVTNIGDYAFSWCTGLTSITIPDSITSIGNVAFAGCTGLTSITIPDSITSIGNVAFAGCTGLTSITIPDSVTSIGDSAFSGCSGLASITIPDNITTIVDKAFFNCTGLTNITIPDGVTSIGSSAFLGCTGLESITIPDSVTRIDERAFSDCNNLSKVYIYDIAKWCNIDFGYQYSNPLYYAHNLYLNGELITNLVIPNSVISIDYQAFYGCTGLTNITIPSSVTSIGAFAFSGCTGLTSITIPDSVTTIGASAFYDCSKLENLTIKGAERLYESCFSSCNSLKNIYLSKNLKTVYNGAFDETDNIENIYYEGSEEEWNAVTILPNNDALKKANVYFNSVGIPDEVPTAPELLRKTACTVTLKHTDGYEYRMNDGEWQSSNIFTGLNPSTEYKFYRRTAAADESPAGAVSYALTVITSDIIKGDINDDREVNILDLISLKKFFADPLNNVVPSVCLDVSGDGRINSADLAALRKNLLLQ